MTRRKPKDGPGIETWRDADLALQELANIDREISLATAAAAVRIEQAREILAQTLEPLKVQRKGFEVALKSFATYHKKVFGKTRSRKLTHGTIGWRKGTGKFNTLKDWNWEKVAEKLEQMGLRGLLRVKKEADKEAIERGYRKGDISEERLASFGLKWTQADEFYYEVKTEGDG